MRRAAMDIITCTDAREGEWDQDSTIVAWVPVALQRRIMERVPLLQKNSPLSRDLH